MQGVSLLFAISFFQGVAFVAAVLRGPVLFWVA